MKAAKSKIEEQTIRSGKEKSGTTGPENGQSVCALDITLGATSNTHAQATEQLYPTRKSKMAKMMAPVSPKTDTKSVMICG